MLSNHHLLLLTKLVKNKNILCVNQWKNYISAWSKISCQSFSLLSFQHLEKTSRWWYHEKKVFRKGKEKLTNGQKCTSLAVLRMHLMIEKNDKCHFIGEEIQNWFYRQKPQTLPDYFEVCMYVLQSILTFHACISFFAIIMYIFQK